LISKQTLFLEGAFLEIFLISVDVKLCALRSTLKTGARKANYNIGMKVWSVKFPLGLISELCGVSSLRRLGNGYFKAHVSQGVGSTFRSKKILKKSVPDGGPDAFDIFANPTVLSGKNCLKFIISIHIVFPHGND
jgi:hypothetical protein